MKDVRVLFSFQLQIYCSLQVKMVKDRLLQISRQDENDLIQLFPVLAEVMDFRLLLLFSLSLHISKVLNFVDLLADMEVFTLVENLLHRILSFR